MKGEKEKAMLFGKSAEKRRGGVVNGEGGGIKAAGEVCHKVAHQARMEGPK